MSMSKTILVRCCLRYLRYTKHISAQWWLDVDLLTGNFFISDRHRDVVGPVCRYSDHFPISIRYGHADWERRSKPLWMAAILKTCRNIRFSAYQRRILKRYFLNIICAKFDICITKRKILMEIFIYAIFDEARRPSWKFVAILDFSWLTHFSYNVHS